VHQGRFHAASQRHSHGEGRCKTFEGSHKWRQLARLHGLKLVPGMPVESFIQAGERTVMSFLVKPLQDQIMKTWREK